MFSIVCGKDPDILLGDKTFHFPNLLHWQPPEFLEPPNAISAIYYLTYTLLETLRILYSIWYQMLIVITF